MESADAVVAGIVLLAIVPIMFVELPAYRRGGYDARFWQLSVEEKLDHIATQPMYWTRLGAMWLPLVVLAVGGLTAFTFQLTEAGAGLWAGLGLGAYSVGALAWLFGSIIQTTMVRSAASLRAEGGATPEWLDGVWTAAWWAEMTFVMAANVAAVAWGVGILDTGYPADWMGWAAILLGALAVLVVAFTREAFPHLGVFMPIVLGIALILY